MPEGADDFAEDGIQAGKMVTRSRRPQVKTPTIDQAWRANPKLRDIASGRLVAPFLG